jgi:hypothetical protein
MTFLETIAYWPALSKRKKPDWLTEHIFEGINGHRLREQRQEVLTMLKLADDIEDSNGYAKRDLGHLIINGHFSQSFAKMKHTFPFLLIVLALSACASQPYAEAYDPPGFFMGLWHGWIMGFAIIGHLFDPTIRIYAFPNSGGWYDFGFVLGAGSWGGAAASKRR